MEEKEYGEVQNSSRSPRGNLYLRGAKKVKVVPHPFLTFEHAGCWHVIRVISGEEIGPRVELYAILW